MKDTLMDYSGGMLNLRFDISNYFYPRYDHQSAFRHADSYGASLQLGGKFDEYPINNNDENLTKSIITPYLSLVLQTDLNLFGDNDVTNKEGYMILGLNFTLQNIHNDFKKHFKLKKSSLGTGEFYTKIYVSEKFGLKISHVKPLEPDNKKILGTRTYISFIIER